MKHYDLKNVEKCYVCGSIDKNINKFLSTVTSNLSKYEKEIHPKEKERQEKIEAQQANSRLMGQHSARRNLRSFSSLLKKKISDAIYDNSIIVVSGNCGIGVKELGYYHAIFEKLEKTLAENNCYIFFIRGNGDDPSIFNECKINYEHIKTIPDYSVIMLKNYNCLCIGGSTSIDRSWKVFQEKEFGKKMFWENEKPTFQKDVLKEILKEYEIGCVISSSSPTFAYPGTNFYNHTKWFKEDKTLQKLFIEERKTLDDIYSTIIEKDTKPYVWAYGRYGNSNIAKINDMVFLSLSKYQINNIGDLIKTNFGIGTNDKLGKNGYSLDEAIKSTFDFDSLSLCWQPVQNHAEEVEREVDAPRVNLQYFDLASPINYNISEIGNLGGTAANTVASTAMAHTINNAQPF